MAQHQHSSTQVHQISLSSGGIPVNPSKTLAEQKSVGKHEFQHQQIREQSYRRLSHQLLILPFVGLMLLALLVYSVFDLYQNAKSKLHYSTTVSVLIAQTASNQRPELVNTQITYALENSPFIDSIVFYPISTPQNTNIAELNIFNIFLEDYVGITEPVTITSYRDSSTPQLIGYIQTALNLSTIRSLWLMNNFPMVILVFLVSVCILLTVLRRVRQVTQRLIPLEKLSQKIIDMPQQFTDQQTISQYISELAPKNTATTAIQRIWVFEKALLQLLSFQQKQGQQLVQMQQTLKQLQDKITTQVYERSIFQNALTHEFKTTLNKMQAGIRLLNNQYLSDEQKDVLELIERAHSDLTSKLNQIIHLQRLEKGQVGIQLEQINPTQLLEQIIATYTPLATQKKLSISLHAHHTEYLLEGDRQKINAIVQAIVKNAVKFTEKGKITLQSQLVHLPSFVIWKVSVQDTGIGIAQKHLSSIFEPFFQVEPDINYRLSDEPNSADTDIDLSIAAKLTELLKGSLTVESELGIGSTFIFTVKLEEWHRHFERLLLKDKTLVVYQQDNGFSAMVDKLQALGAMVSVFNDSTQVSNYLAEVAVDALLFSPEINHEMIHKLCQHIRQQETQHRTLIILYYQQNHVPNFEALEAVGVDYFENYDPQSQQSEQNLKRLLELLH